MARVIRRPGNVSLNQIRVDMADIGRKKLKIGWFESAKYDDDTPVAYVASIQEFGAASASIPPRSFFRTTIAEKKGEWIRRFDIGITRVIAGILTMEDFLNIIGLRISGQVRQKIASIEAPPLSPVTLALRKQKIAGKKIGGALVGAVAKAIEEGKTGPGELGDSSGINPKPLVFDGILLNTLTYSVSDNDTRE